jgi:hypothetical protein
MDDYQLTKRLEAIEAQLLLVSQHLGVPCPPFASTGFAAVGGGLPAPTSTPLGGPPPLSPAQLEIVSLARSGNKLEAIKRYRELTGADLAEAKRAVEAM